MFAKCSRNRAMMVGMKPPFATILVPVDGSTTSERGVSFALELSGGRAVLIFCSVVDPTLLCIPAAEGAGLDYGPLLRTLDEDAEIFCKEAAARAAAAGIAAQVSVCHGQCVAALEEASRAYRAEAIVIGSHGRTGIDRIMLGSIAEGLLRAIEIPVIVAHEDDENRTGPVLVALDDSPAAQAALEEAVTIARTRGNSLALVHVLNTAYEAADEPRADALLNAAAEYARGCGLNVSLGVRTGDPCSAIVAAADALESCMIVMGTHGRSTIPRLVLGSVAMGVVERARIPVATIRRAGRTHGERPFNAEPARVEGAV